MPNPNQTNADNEPNDQFGYSCYAILIPAPDSIVEPQQEIWRRYPTNRSTIPAHITVKGTFVHVSDLDEVKQKTREIASDIPAFWIGFEELEIRWRTNSGTVWLPSFPEIQRLHDRLVAAIGPISDLRYPDDPYRVHMGLTTMHEPEVPEALKAEWEAFDFGDGFWAERVDLMGRVGQAYDGEWQTVERFPLKG